jgi:hypothetical protein
MAETQMKTWRLHRRRGEAYPYFCNFAQASLVVPFSTLNVAPILPAGTVVDINGALYVTRNVMSSLQLGDIDPLEWHPAYIMPKKVGDSFADRAAVYWDPTNCYATSSSGGSNVLIGLAVSNGDLGTATNGTSSALTTAASGASTIISGTSADGQVGAYAAADTFIEVELVLSTSTSVSFTGQSVNTIVDPGTAASIAVTAGGICALTIAGIGETRGLPVPTFDGQDLLLTIGGFTASATCKVALGGAYNATPSTTIDGTNKFVTFNAFGQAVLLKAIAASASTFQWMLVSKVGATLAAS